MSDVILIIESLCSAPDCSLNRLLSVEPGYRVQRFTWESFGPAIQADCVANLVAVVAVPKTDEVTGFFKWLRDNPIKPPFFAVLPAEPDDELLSVASRVADDFMVLPVKRAELQCRIRRLLGPGTPCAESVHRLLTREAVMAQIVGNNTAFTRAIEQIPPIAASDAPVLLTGETGTGKELCARAIHLLSRRHSGPFIPVECGALPENLAENELFGDARGAFTDAQHDRKGLVAMAEGGTLFLDEIDTLPLSIRATLVRLLEESCYRPRGAEQFSKADIRVIAATNSNLGGVCSKEIVSF